MQDLSLTFLATAFAAGVISFLSPCVLPLVPGYVSFVAGTSLEELRDQKAPRLQVLTLAVDLRARLHAWCFVALGASATALGQLPCSATATQLGLIAGIVVILFGLHLPRASPRSAG